ncbi:MAG TPA: hypothetical protein VNB06_00775 [Thermoanaerobaculia bacterium]|nr:hypothetical protein [Thermoanaerobaculia bacterium]
MHAPRSHRRALVAVVALLLTATAVLLGIASLMRGRADREREQALDRTLALEARWVRSRLKRLESVAAELIAIPAPVAPAGIATTGSADPSAPALANPLEGLATTRGLDLIAVAGPGGELLWSSLASAASAAQGGELDRLARRLGDGAAAAESRSGLVSSGEALYAVAWRTGTPRGEDRVPSVVVAQRVDATVVRELAQAVEAELAFLVDTGSGPALGAASLDPRIAQSVPLELRRLGIWRTVLQRATSLELALDGEAWDAQLAPLYGFEGGAVGVAAALLPRRDGLGLGPLLALVALLPLVAVAGIVFASLPPERALATAGPAAEQPADLLAAALTQARGGAGLVVPEGLPSGFDRLEEAVVELAGERQRLHQEAETTKRRGTPRFELSSSDAPLRVTVEELALLAVELRGLARGDTVRQAEATLLRARRDVESLRGEIERHGGRVEAWLGHRLLASFAGDGAVLSGVRAVAAITRRLGASASAFEEPRPPAAALAFGAVAVGVGSEDEASARALAGRPLQQLDELLREAMVGDLMASQEVVKQAGEELERQGISVREHAGLRTVQKVYVVDLASVGSQSEGPAAAPMSSP